MSKDNDQTTKENVKDEWCFDESGNGENKLTILVNKNQPDFFFEIQRIRDEVALTERLKITIVRDDYKAKPNFPSVETSIFSIEERLVSLKEYGVFLNRNRIIDIRKLIEKKYSQIAVEDRKIDEYGIPDDVYDGVIYSIYEYKICEESKMEEDSKKSTDVNNKITDANSKTTDVNNKYYYIESKDFIKIISESDYSGVDIGKLRRKLKEDGILHANANRTDLVIKDRNNRPMRVLAVIKDKLNSAIEEINKKLNPPVSNSMSSES